MGNKNTDTGFFFNFSESYSMTHNYDLVRNRVFKTSIRNVKVFLQVPSSTKCLSFCFECWRRDKRGQGMPSILSRWKCSNTTNDYKTKDSISFVRKWQSTQQQVRVTSNDPNVIFIWPFRKISRSDSISIQSIQYSIESLKDEIKLLKVNEDDNLSQATSQQFSNSMTSDVLQIGIGFFTENPSGRFR